jgi:small subunit ribosomal protein S21
VRPTRDRVFGIQSPQRKERSLRVFVNDNNVDQALRVLKKKMQREGTFREMKRRRFYEKPSELRVRKKSEAIRRARKLARKQAQREGLIADPRKKKLPVARAFGNRQRMDGGAPPSR